MSFCRPPFYGATLDVVDAFEQHPRMWAVGTFLDPMAFFSIVRKSALTYLVSPFLDSLARLPHPPLEARQEAFTLRASP